MDYSPLALGEEVSYFEYDHSTTSAYAYSATLKPSSISIYIIVITSIFHSRFIILAGERKKTNSGNSTNT